MSNPFDTPHSRRGIDQADRDAPNYLINGKPVSQRQSEDAERQRLAEIAALMDQRIGAPE